MRKLYVVCTTSILLVVLIHIIYMVALSGGHYSEDFAMNLGYTLMSLAILHGVYGLVKWIKVLVKRQQMSRAENGRKSPAFSTASKITLVQRVSGILVVALVVPHTLINLVSADALSQVIDILFVLAVILHLFIGIPKWLVSTGLLGKRLQEKLSAFYGGKGNA